MKNVLTKIFAVISASVFAAGCIEETFPQGGTVTKDQVLASDNSMSTMVNGIPGSMMGANTAGYYTNYGQQSDFGIPAIHLMTENMLEDLAFAGNPGYNHFGSYYGNLYQGDAYTNCAYFWDCYYMWIKDANDIIALVDPETASATELDALGQAYTYRAMCYLDLARLYEPKENGYTDVSGVLGLTVPIVTEETTEEDAMNNPRATREQMYTFILSDLKMAEDCFKAAQSPVNSYTRPTLMAVYGLYARAYLEKGAAGDQGAYDQAITYADMVISQSGRTPLTQSQWEDPSNGFNNGAATNSWIWGLTLNSTNTNNLFNFTAMFSCEATWGYGPLLWPAVSKKLYDAIPDADFRKHSWLDPSLTEYYDYQLAGSEDDKSYFLYMVQYYNAVYASIKFRPMMGEVNDYAVGTCTEHPLMRIEEMYFIKMEATAQKDGNPTAAAAILEEFMTHRYTEGAYDCTATSLEDFLTEMLFQKRVEFWGEGILFYDYKRLDAGITRSYEGSNVPEQYQFNTTGRSPQWNIVITRGEFQSNTGITDALNNPDPSGRI